MRRAPPLPREGARRGQRRPMKTLQAPEPERKQPAYDVDPNAWAGTAMDVHARAHAEAKREADALLSRARTTHAALKKVPSKAWRAPEGRAVIRAARGLSGKLLDGPEHRAWMEAADRLLWVTSGGPRAVLSPLRRGAPRARRAPRRVRVARVPAATSGAGSGDSEGPPSPAPAPSGVHWGMTGICGHRAGALVCSRAPHHPGKHSDGVCSWSDGDVRRHGARGACSGGGRR
jgi:hypothetical protein